jgi:hypothetical protein
MPPQHHSYPNDNDLLSELQSHNAYFDSLVNMIPARLYIAGASGDDAYNPKYGKGQHKESKEARRARSKIAKRDKFDPNKMETTLETKRRVQLEAQNQSDDESDGDDDGNDNIVMSDDDGEVDASADVNTNAVHPTSSGNTSSNSNNKDSTATTTNSVNNDTQTYASRIEMLRAKLHAKMAEKRAIAAGMSVEEYTASSSSGAIADGDASKVDSSATSKRAARRAEKRKRQEAAKQRNKKNGYSTVIENSKQGNGNNQQQNWLGGKSSSTSNSFATFTNSPTTAAQDLATIDYQSLAGLKPKLDGALNNKSLVGVAGGTSAAGGLSKKKSLEKLLADAERKQARLRELKASGNEEDKEKAKNIEWGETLKVAG